MGKLNSDDEGIQTVNSLKHYINGCYYCNLIYDFVIKSKSKEFLAKPLSKHLIAKEFEKQKKMSYKTAIKHINDLIEAGYLIDFNDAIRKAILKEHGITRIFKSGDYKPYFAGQPLPLSEVLYSRSSDINSIELIRYTSNWIKRLP
jgi:hypothetical protein